MVKCIITGIGSDKKDNLTFFPRMVAAENWLPRVTCTMPLVTKLANQKR